MRRLPAILWMVVAALMVTSALPASAQQAGCLAGKNKCVSKKSTALLKCNQLARTPGKPPDPNANECVTKAVAKFDGGAQPEKGCFERLESKVPNDCITQDDTGTAETVVDTCVATLVSAIDVAPIGQTKCGAGKLKCVAKYLKSVLKCHQVAQTPGKPTDPNVNGCLDKATAKYDGGANPPKGCFAKLEGAIPNDCQTQDDATTVKGLADTCLTQLDAALAGGAAACGNNVKEGTEQCDGSDAAACPGSCRADCTCPAQTCGNNVREGTEQCDGSDATACPGSCQANCICPVTCPATGGDATACTAWIPGTGPCRACMDANDPFGNITCSIAHSSTCTDPTLNDSCSARVNAAGCGPECCPSCGNNVREGAEQCDGSDATFCPGTCQADCTCPQVCGDNLREGTEECDGSSDAACPGNCQADCTCRACGSSSYPACGGTCPVGQACAPYQAFDIMGGPSTSGCVCVNAEAACSGTVAACSCDPVLGLCPSGQACVLVGSCDPGSGNGICTAACGPS